MIPPAIRKSKDRQHNGQNRKNGEEFEDTKEVVVFNATFNDISVISWWSVLLLYLEKTIDL